MDSYVPSVPDKINKRTTMIVRGSASPNTQPPRQSPNTAVPTSIARSEPSYVTGAARPYNLARYKHTRRSSPQFSIKRTDTPTTGAFAAAKSSLIGKVCT